MSEGKKLVDGATIMGFLTAYLHGVHAIRGGKMSAGDAMNHIIDLQASAMEKKKVVDHLIESSIGRLRPKD